MEVDVQYSNFKILWLLLQVLILFFGKDWIPSNRSEIAEIGKKIEGILGVNIQQAQIQNAPPPNPSYTSINTNKIWNSLIYPLPIPPHPISLHTMPPLVDYHTNFPLKFLPQYSFYIDGSFKPPKVKEDGTIIAEKAGHGIFNLGKNLTISKQLPGLQNILMAIHHAL